MTHLPDARRTLTTVVLAAGLAFGCKASNGGLSRSAQDQIRARELAQAEGVRAPGATRSAASAQTWPTSSPPQVMTFTVSDGGLTGPDSVMNGQVEVRVTNTGKSIHEVRFLKLPENATVAQALSVIAQRGRLPPNLQPQGGVGPLPPGGSGTVFNTMKDGVYIVVCSMPSSDGKPWFTKGVIASLRVTGHAPEKLQPATLSAASSIATSEAAWRFSTTLTRGDRTLAFEGRARSTSIARGSSLMMLDHFGVAGHDAVIIRGSGPRAMSEYADWLTGASQKAPDVVGGVPGLIFQMRAYIKLNLTPGSYIIFCPTLKRGAGGEYRGFELGEFDQFVVK